MDLEPAVQKHAVDEDHESEDGGRAKGENQTERKRMSPGGEVVTVSDDACREAGGKRMGSAEIVGDVGEIFDGASQR